MKYKKIVIAVLAVFVVGGCVVWKIVSARDITFDPDESYSVVSVLDGDTFKARVGGKIITVRMLGIDTPETVDPRKEPQCYGKEASDETKKLLSGNSIYLKQNPKREKKDKYGRYLAYVRLDKIFINEYLIENGFAREYTFGTAYSLQKEFRELEKRARLEKRGLWGKCETNSTQKR